MLFGLLGLGLDKLFGTRPVFMLVFGAIAFIGAFASTYFRYQARIAKDEEGKPWAHKN